MTKFLVLLLLCGTCIANAADKAVVKADTRESFATVAAHVREEMGDGGQYAYVKPDEREKVETNLAEMAAFSTRTAPSIRWTRRRR